MFRMIFHLFIYLLETDNNRNINPINHTSMMNSKMFDGNLTQKNCRLFTKDLKLDFKMLVFEMSNIYMGTDLCTCNVKLEKTCNQLEN